MAVMCNSRWAEEAGHNANGWVTVDYHLPSHLPDFAHLTLRSMEVAAVTPTNSLMATQASDTCLGYVGQSLPSFSTLLHSRRLIWDVQWLVGVLG